jgi:ferredoxin-nitrate reductase
MSGSTAQPAALLPISVDNTTEHWGRTQCPYCGVGCGLLVQIEDGQTVRVKGDPEHPANFGDVCAKAVMLPRALHTPDRLLHPHLRPRRDQTLTRVPWSVALKTVARTLCHIIAQYGPDAVALYGSGQLLTEDYYVANKLAKGFLGTNNFDANSRLCMASAVAGYKNSLGSDGPPAAYADLEQADVFFIIGSNTAACHPIVFRRIKRRKELAPDEVKVIVVDPRRTETADIADLHLPIRPGADVALLNAMLSVLIEHGLVDQPFIAAHTQGWEALRDQLARYTPEAVQDVCGLSARRIREAALLFGQGRSVLSLWSMGLNQSTSGVQKNQAIINLHLATGQIGKPGAGPFSLTGQPNAMGGREVGGLSHLLPGYRSVLDPQHRAEVAAVWGVPAAHLSATPGYSAVELFHALADGQVKAVWIMGTNPAVSMPDLDVVEKGLRQAELVVVQDAYHPTDTTAFADVLLPAAQWPEKEGVMTNSERTLTYLPRLLEPPGEAIADWHIVTLVARELGFGKAFPYNDSEAIFEEFKGLTTGQMMDISGVSYARLRQAPVQWPCPARDHPGTPRLYTDRRFPTPDGRARFMTPEHADPVERPSRHYPLVLTTGRVKHQWHTMTRTGKVENLLKSCREPFVELHPQDARRSGVQDGDFVELTSRRGKLVAQARVTAEIALGTCFVPFHWGRRMGFYKCVNNLTVDAVDPISKEPELKAAAVRVKKLEEFSLALDEAARVSAESEVP